MTYRELHGLSFRVWSPSTWELVVTQDAAHISCVTLAYTGGAWRIVIQLKSGRIVENGAFGSLSDAAAFIAERRAA